MRIAILPPLFEIIPPRKYGGTERVIHNLVEELVSLGHDVTLYGVSGSKTSARLVDCDKPIGVVGVNPPEIVEPSFAAQLKLVLDNISEYDIVHVHHSTWSFHPRVMAELTNNGTTSYPILWTDHDRLPPAKGRLVQELGDLNIGYTALSMSHRESVPNANNFLSVVYNGIPVNLLTPKILLPTTKTQPYVAFIGRMFKDKNPVSAVKIANGAGYHLKAAGPVPDYAQDYFKRNVEALFKTSEVDHVGEIDDVEKQEFLSNATALIFPIAWREPFGLVMIEAMACGCPVIAYRNGSVDEVIDDGITGFVVDSEEEAIQALKRVHELDRRRIRAVFEERFTSTRMTLSYLETYKRVIKMHKARQQKEVIDAAVQSINMTKYPLEYEEPSPITSQILMSTKVGGI